MNLIYLFLIFIVIVFFINQLYHLFYNRDSFEISSKDIAYVSGYIGPESSKKEYATTRIPKKIPGADCYFVTNILDVAKKAENFGWIPRMVKSPTDQSYRGCSMACKRLKVFPQSFLRDKKKFVIWFDNKFDIISKQLSPVLNKWDNSKAIAMHKHPLLSNSKGLGSLQKEFDHAMGQERYQLEKQKYLDYINLERRNGYSTENQRHFTTCFIIYNLRHPETLNFQNTWWEHINRCGIQCQISMYFVAQRYPDILHGFKGGGHCGG
tara:strand:- start:1114 stop:1911 length:798 start_codon:yes stop_codon:yes gene_type:complete